MQNLAAYDVQLEYLLLVRSPKGRRGRTLSAFDEYEVRLLLVRDSKGQMLIVESEVVVLSPALLTVNDLHLNR